MKITQLYLIRHGIAVAREEYTVDAQRPLAMQGRLKTQRVAQRLIALQIHFDLILTSPLARARQTAEILQAKGLGFQIEESSTLAPGGSFDQWLMWLKAWQCSGRRALALVGHQPDLCEWAESLIWGEARQILELKKAGVIGLTLPSQVSPVGKSQLFWLTPPRLLL